MEATINWLHENTKSRFANAKQVDALVENALTQYRALQPKVAQYVSENGVREALLCLHGTLPVPFGGSSFNIPVVFWLPRGFPEAPPMTFVTPTRRMVIKVSNSVDGRGRVYHPYMTGWSNTSTLVELFQNLIMLFSKEPPVYSTPSSAVAATAKPLTASPQMSLGSASMSTLPYAGTASMSSLPSIGTMSMNSLPQSVPITVPMATTASSPRPNTAMPRSSALVRPASSVENDLATLNAPGSANSHSTPSPTKAQLPHSPNVAVAAAEHATASSVPITSPIAAKVTASPARHQPQSSLLDDEPMDDPQKRLLGYQLAILDKVIGAVDKSREKHTRVNKELLDQSANLNSGAGVIAEERHQLLESQRQLSANISVLENKLNELNEKKNEFPDVSQIKDVCQIFRGQTPAMEQLFSLAGEISAIDDTIYILGKALNDGKLSVGVYMRQIRKLAQQQFMAKALAFKIRELCSLDKT
ncbi:suppressor protein stp22 of temperature-sensitive alpha-factor receptor and arginine permease [Coemansia sp. RSA 1843]|nr:suppressor protein stp22 of temperature-sensitive alpha-factor receptor and arginine permease [Coemansia sp. RSA 1843]